MGDTVLDPLPTLSQKEEGNTNRIIAFPPEHVIHEEKIHPRPRGVEMKRNLTQEDRELAAAGYHHLDTKQTKTGPEQKETRVDIHEHSLPFCDLEKVLNTSLDLKDAARSSGLSEEEAKERLSRDGPNMLTPPKKKSALRTVCANVQGGVLILNDDQFLERLFTMFNILLIIAGVLVFILLAIDVKVNRPLSVLRMNAKLVIGEHPKFLSWRNLDLRCLPERRNRLLPDPKVRGHPCLFFGPYSPFMPRNSGQYD